MVKLWGAESASAKLVSPMPSPAVPREIDVGPVLVLDSSSIKCDAEWLSRGSMTSDATASVRWLLAEGDISK